MRHYSWAVSLALLSLLGCDAGRPLEPAIQAAGAAGPALTAPSNTNAVADSPSGINVSWRDNSNNETGFEVHRSTAGPSGAFALRAATGAGVTTYGDGEVMPSTQYCYKVRAFQTNGRKTTYSPFSSTSCATTPAPPQPGSIKFTTATTGSYLDPDGYYVVLDGGPERSIGANDSLTIPGVSAGQHTVLIYHIAWNCSLAGANPRSVTVNGGITNVALSITCGPGNTIQVTGATTGVDLDPDGYSIDLWLNWGWSRVYAGSATVPANGTVTFYALTPGEYDVEFSGWTPNCTPLGPNPRRVDLTSTASVTLDVTCVAATQIAFADITDGNAEIYVIKANGTGRTRLTTHPASDVEPAWSPDGSKIAFVSDRDGNSDIYVMQSDGSNPVRLTDNPASDGSPTWSPDGTRIAFVSNRDGDTQIYVMGADGTGVTATGQPGSDPAWSPDGQKIAFASGGIFVMNVDGTGVSQLTTPAVAPDAQPAWSPGGQWLAFARTQTESGTNIWAVSADGSYAVQMTLGGCGCDVAASPTWSPDGSFTAAFAGTGFGFSDYTFRVFITYGYQTAEFLTVGFDPSWHR